MNTTVAKAEPLAADLQKKKIARFFRKWALQIAVLLVLILLWVFFLWRAPITFSSHEIYSALMTTTPYYGLIAIPLTLVIIAKEIDLSFPSVTAWGMTMYYVVYTLTGSAWLGFFACLLAGLLAGLMNGLIVVRLGIPSLVATLGTQYLWRGAVMVVTNGKGVGMPEVKSTLLYPALVGKIGNILGGIPASFIWMIIFAVVTWFFLNRHKFGAHVYLTGDNEESARLMGVNTRRTKMITFAIVGVAAAFSGFLISEQLLFFWPTLGDSLLLNTLASVFLGGTSVFGGTGTIFGTFVASFIIAIINPGIVASGWTAFLTQLIYGFIIVISISLQALLRRRLS